MLYEITWQPFAKYGITFYRKKSTKEYFALEEKRTAYGSGYSKQVAKNSLLQVVISEIENYILNKKLRPIETDEEDIL